MRLGVLAVLLALVSAPASAAWHEARSKHFVVYADQDPAELRQFAEKLERFDAAVREARGVPDVAEGAATRVTLFVVRDLRELRKVYGDDEASVGGFYIPKASGSVAFVPEEVEKKGKFRLSSESIFFHEYTHHLMLQSADRPLPTWLTEGFAEFFANPQFNPDGSVVIGAPPRYRAGTLYSGEFIPLPKMLSGDYLYVTQGEYASLYGRGWLLTHLLSFDLKRRGQLTSYLNDIQAGIPAMTAATKAFGDLKQLDRELNAYFKGDTFTVATIPAHKLRLPPIAVRPLRPGEAEMMSVKVRLARGGSELKAKELAGRARGIARKYPDEAAVHTTVALMELEAGYPAAAVAAADRALALEPNSDQALLAKAKGLLALAKDSPKTANWDAIRLLISRANKLDPENAEPLALFYRTYVGQNVRPTANALSGLGYAVALAPQDANLRLEYVGQMIEEQRWADAGRALIPLAYSPHRGKWHDAVVAVLEQVNARNPAEAKSRLQAARKHFAG
ncbi:hypothetical protein [Sphingomonas sp.]|uniref:hypothetical protein n=1 Tax=Sphingomonas sp. TaxID=28214 RepID=UPI00286E711F|nr:hypothetical protein [Sphingomonas sp.]